MAKKIPSNFYQEVNIRKLDKVFANGSDIPEPSVSDEGKVIKVDNTGKYALLPDGGAATMTVNITYDETTDDYSADKTHTEIVEAIAAGVIVKATYDNLTFVYAGTNKPAAFDGVYFTYIQADSEDQLLCKCFEIDVDDRIVYSSHDISEELPVVDTEDNGKVLGVVGGVWDKMNVPTELPAVTSADYEKILTVDSNGNWIAALDRLHLGDVWEVPQGTSYVSVISQFNQILTPAITISLPKYIDEDVKWFEFATDINNPLITITDKTGAVVARNVPFNDLFEIKYAWSQMSRDYINLALYIKSAYQATLTPYLGDILFYVFNNTYLRMIATKPTT